ncbi:hypothetical protein [Cellulomonas sp. S1-8]|uniref:hypothetical protein n=1 Tax=Cellulomonas sp. S1-8 TaxID=2904790 RepID=UPI002243581E|nr:hypothetical protein [Cellulomonas sp. S1-8]UZN03675.1 hypothetical protein OKX07_01655 [Cellulomonas sp. S1-8]
MTGGTYEVSVAGVVSLDDLRHLGAVSVATERASVVLYGDLPDEAALFGLLARVRALGLELLEVRRVPDLRPLEDRATAVRDDAAGPSS